MSENLNLKTISTIDPSPFKHLCVTIGELPSAFIESMSYYELLAWFVNYLENTVIPAVNANGEATAELQELFIELKTFVDTYFDNLDVQEEINNKLDAMVEAGTLQEIIGEYLNATAVWGFDTVADMIASTNLINGSYARTLGYNAKNDRGGATYKIRTITNDDVVDGGAIIEMDDDTLVAELIHNGTIWAEQYGCYGDGVHDDTVQFKKLITFLTGKEIILGGEGIYLLTEAVTLGDIDIDMPTAKIITNFGITINGATNRTLNLPKVVSTAENNYAGITMMECYTNNVTINHIEGFNKGLLLTSSSSGCVYNTVNILEIKNCLNSLILQPQNTGWVNQNIFIGGRLWNDSSYETAHGADIIKIALLGTSTHNVNNNTFIGLCIEGNEGSANGLKIKLDYASTNYFENIRYEGTSPKVSSTNNSNANVIRGGYNAINLTYTNDPVAYEVPGITYFAPKAGSQGSKYLDIQVSGNTYPIMTAKNTSGQTTFKVFHDGFETVQASNGNSLLKINANGISGYDGNQTAFVMMRSYGGHTNLTNADGTNHCVVIAPGSNTNNGAFLWVYDGHLYGKMGSKPSTSTDGTVIL